MKKHIKILIMLMVVGITFSISHNVTYASSVYEGAQGYQSGVEYNDKLSSYIVGSGSSDYASEFNEYKTYIINHDGENITRPFPLKKGGLNITMYGFYQATGEATIYSDEACTEEVGKISLTDKSKMTDSQSFTKTVTISIPATKTYYIRFTNTTGKNSVFQFSSQQYDGRNRTLKSQKELTYIDSSLGNLYYLINVEEDGYITLKPEFCNNGYKKTKGNVNMTLMDTSKKPLTSTKIIGNTAGDFSSKAVYAVEAGQYYVKVSTDQQRIFAIKCSKTAVEEQAGSKKGNSKKMAFNKWYKGICTWKDTTSQGDYYKFTLKKASKVTISLSGDVCSGKIVGTVTGNTVNGSYSGLYLKKIGAKNSWGFTSKNMKKTNQLPAGTYYIKLSKDTKKTNGYYKLKVSLK